MKKIVLRLYYILLISTFCIKLFTLICIWAFLIPLSPIVWIVTGKNYIKYIFEYPFKPNKFAEYIINVGDKIDEKL